MAVTVTGATTAMYFSCALTGPLPDGLTMQALSSDANEVSFKFYNTTAGSISAAVYTARLSALLPQ
ncbi:hypothetical protein [Pseudooceanicola sp.]|uniref:hypothetical protein n=1 Tax=Pseudooceanicola sp. TaxID=1914328 RepID=UPI003511C719